MVKQIWRGLSNNAKREKKNFRIKFWSSNLRLRPLTKEKEKEEMLNRRNVSYKLKISKFKKDILANFLKVSTTKVKIDDIFKNSLRNLIVFEKNIKNLYL